MMTNSLRGVFLFALAMLVAPLTQAQEAGGAAKPESVLREFYSWYTQTVLADRSPLSDERAKLKRYATAAMLGRIDKTMKAGELSSDPFLHAQDLDKAWPKNIKVSKTQVSGKTATAEVEMKGPEMGSHKLGVSLREEDGAWKIDKVDAK